jgi:hypothetical protein
VNENPIPLTFSPSYSAEKWSTIAALLDDLAPALREDEPGESEDEAPKRTRRAVL